MLKQVTNHSWIPIHLGFVNLCVHTDIDQTLEGFWRDNMIYMAFHFRSLQNQVCLQWWAFRSREQRRHQQNQKLQGLSYCSLEVLKVPVTITVTCALSRKQFSPPKQPEISVLDTLYLPCHAGSTKMTEGTSLVILEVLASQQFYAYVNTTPFVTLYYNFIHLHIRSKDPSDVHSHKTCQPMWAVVCIW
jgi:hypothetical protein